jgi:rhamnulokinase
MAHVIAVDLGASSGRVTTVAFDGSRLHLSEVHRFANVPVMARGTLYWDVLRLWHDIQEGIAAARPDALSVGVDTWGVDFAFLDKAGDLLSNVVTYRDTNRFGAMEWVFERVPRRTIFERTGVQFIILNGLYQLAHMARSSSPLLPSIGTAFTIADLFHYWLSGERVAEFTMATTTQCFNPIARDWDTATASALGFPEGIFAPVVAPGTRLGDYQGLPVVLPASHDTGSAVVAIPATHDDIAYISSGTWSLVGLEVDEPQLTEAAYRANVTSEGGFERWRLLKNVMGLWLVQQCRATWAAQGQDFSYEHLSEAALRAPGFSAFIDPDDLRFLPPGDMPARIRDYCAQTGQPAPGDEATTVRIIYESLALKYRYVIDTLRDLTGRQLCAVHIIGGGSQNTVLCQMTADATGVEVIAGPVEATALGNGIVQLIALGELGSIRQAREILSRDVALRRYTPQDTAVWQQAYERFRAFVERTSHATDA